MQSVNTVKDFTQSVNMGLHRWIIMKKYLILNFEVRCILKLNSSFINQHCSIRPMPS